MNFYPLTYGRAYRRKYCFVHYLIINSAALEGIENYIHYFETRLIEIQRLMVEQLKK